MDDRKRPTEHSMKRRASWHDYSAQGAYMLTLAVEGRRPLLGRLVTEPKPRVEMSALGAAIRSQVLGKLTAVYPQLEVWRVCIMPDHIHMIVRVRAPLPEGKSLGFVVKGFKQGCNRAYWRLLGIDDASLGREKAENAMLIGNGPRANGSSRVQAGIELPVLGLSMPEKKERSPRPHLFEPGYNDRLLFDGAQLDRWKHYLDDNPRRLALKRLRPDLFTIRHGRQIGNWNCQLVGNIFLLDIPDKVAVVVHRADSDDVFAQKKAAWLACGERGGVIVSAAISKREKEVMREAMERGYSLILLKDNGFPEFYKPSGEAFDACARGQLLQVSPWPYHMEERTISREQCLELNRLAEEIVSREATQFP